MQTINKLTEQIIGAAIAVHREKGPGLLESSYEVCLAHVVNERFISESSASSGLKSISGSAS